MIVVYQSDNNPDIGFALDFDEEYFENGSKLAKVGWDAWWYATHPEDWEDESILTKEDVKNCYDLGYMEMALDLLDRADIPYATVYCFDDEGNFDANKIDEYMECY